MMTSYRGEAPQHAQSEEDDETAMARRKHSARVAEKSMDSSRGLGASGGIQLSARSKELKKAGHVAVATVHKRDESHGHEATPAPEPAPEPAAEP